MVIAPAFGTFGSGGRCEVLLENEISISIKLVSRRKHEVLYDFLVDGCVDCGLQKTQWTNTSRWHGSPNHHWLETSHWTSSNMDSVPLHSSSRLWNLDFQMKSYIFFYLKRGLWTTEQQFSGPGILILIPGKMLLTLFLFQKWLGSPFPEDVWVWWLLMHWLQLQFTPCKALPSVWIGFTWQYYQACGHLCCLCTFSCPISSFQSTLI